MGLLKTIIFIQIPHFGAFISAQLPGLLLLLLLLHPGAQPTSYPNPCEEPAPN